ncbi:hypothetical protein ILUMI_26992 [Ignelater luminosus]|uniref:EF-hand domain-containing protein n=1 Tax=Ignelater luminosus TaxID=2038154 RepID=A0A8K0C3X3_IGNLU|nr:hypothetical protein ILUMI_26992 [Ignelater luminosus]
MDSVIMTSPGNSTRLKSRLRNAATSLLARSSKNRQTSNKNHAINHKNNRNINSRSNSLRNNTNLRQVNNYNRNINGNHENSNCINNNGNLPPTKNIQNNTFYRGAFAREVYSTICSRLGHTPYIPGDLVQTIFNDMHLYPSKSQVSEMLQCARQCGRRNGTTPFLTFGEFCVFAREMQRPKSHRKAQQQRTSNKCTKNCEVFLGGSCNPTTWRADTAIPELQKHGISYYNPQRSIWGPELVAEEFDAKQSASVLLFVVDSQTRSVSGMIEVAYLVASSRCVVVVTHPYKLGQSIMGEELSYREYLDLMNGQAALLALVKSQGVRVHSNLTSALQRTTFLLQNSTANGISPEEQVISKLRTLRDTFDSYDVNRTGDLHLNDVLDAYYRLTNKTLQISELYNYLSTSNNSDTSKMRISFEQFCALVAEFSIDGCNTSMSDDWASQPLQRQCSANNNTHCDNTHANCPVSNHTSKDTTNKETWLADVYLGGSCRTGSTWRENIAIPLLKKHGLTYYNPAIREANCTDNSLVNEENVINGHFTNGSMYFNGENDEVSVNGESAVLENCMLQRKRAMDKSKVLLFVVTNDTRSLTSMILASHYIGLGADNVVLCIEQLPSEDCQLSNETLSKQAIKDYNRGRVYLMDVAKRRQVSVFENITEAVQCAIDKCQGR